MRIPGIQSCSPIPTAAARVPLTMATALGAPAIKIGSVNDRCRGTSNPGVIELSRDRGATGESEEGEKEGCCRERNCKAEHHLHQPSEPSARVSKRESQARNC